MSSIYKVGANVLCPAAGAHGDKGNILGNICSIRSGSNMPYVKWNDGIEGHVKPAYLITKEKYDELRGAGFSDNEISEYVRMFNGNIYN